MKHPTHYPNLGFLTRIGAVALAATCLGLARPAAGQTIQNPSFEVDTFTVSPGYISGNTPITGWTASNNDKVGLNPAGDSPFADNGVIPDGVNVAFIQSDSGNPVSLSTIITGLTPGTTYKLTFWANARNGGAPSGQEPNLRVQIDGLDILAGTGQMRVRMVGGTNPYYRVAVEFTALLDTHTLSLVNDAAGDNTVLLDDFRIAASSGQWTVNAWTGDGDSGVDSSFFYTHAYNFGSTASPVINSVTFIGIGGNGPSDPGKFSTAYLAYGPVGDTSVNISGNSATLAATFVYGGYVPAGQFESITMNGLTPGTEYIVTIYSVAWEDPSGPTVRWGIFNMGEDRLTINQDRFGNNNGIAISYRYTADASGNATISFAPYVWDTTIHTYGFCNREANIRDVAPVINIQPKGQTVAAGGAVSFSVLASGVPAPFYQWRKDGQEIFVVGSDTPTLSLSPVAATDAGDYDVVVANSAGSVTSAVARLVVGLEMVNASFEVDTFGVWPGYVSGNFPITGWNALGGHGLNPAGGSSPFADNGAIPNGIQVAFMQQDGAMSQVINNLNPGSVYYVHYYENARTGPQPSNTVTLAGNVIVPMHTVVPVGGGNPYYEMFSDAFTATDTSAELDFIKGGGQLGDCTVLIDNVAVVEILPSAPPFIVAQPQPQLVQVGQTATFSARALGYPTLTYQWLKDGAPIDVGTGPTLILPGVLKRDEGGYSVVVANDGGAVTSAVPRLTVFEPIPDLYSSGVDNTRLAAADGTVDLHYQLIQNADSNSPNAIIEDSTVFPISTATWLPDTSISKWIGPQFNTAASAVGTYVYRTTFVVTNDPDTVVILGHWSTDNEGIDILVNGVSTGNPQNTGFNYYTPFAIASSNATFVVGTNTLDFHVENVAAIGYTGVRIEILFSNLRIPPGQPATITAQPQGVSAVEGDTVNFAVVASGTAPISYQWRKDGQPLDGQTGTTLTLTQVTVADQGNYTVIVSNEWGRVVSVNAPLVITARMIPVAFGTGVATDGTLLPDAAVDPHYIMASSADTGFPGPDAIVVNSVWPIQVGVWLPNGPDSKWIGPSANQGVGNAEGDYTFQTTVDLTGYDPAQVRLIGGWAVDNTGLDILVNGISTGLVNNGGFGGFTPFAITSGLIDGVNTLDFIINNAPATPNPVGLRVNLKGYLNLQPVIRAQLTITLSGSDVTVSWTPANANQKLWSAPTVDGPWTEILNAPNPYPTSATGPAQFFKVTETTK